MQLKSFKLLKDVQKMGIIYKKGRFKMQIITSKDNEIIKNIRKL